MSKYNEMVLEDLPKCPRCGSGLLVPQFWCDRCGSDYTGAPTLKELSEIDTILKQIELAFLGVALEDGVTISDAYNEEIRDKDNSTLFQDQSLLRWRDVEDSALETMFSALFAFDSKGWKFHLPAFMTWVLKFWRKSMSPTPDWLISSLTRNFGVIDYYDSLDLDQSRAVLSFLQYCSAHLDPELASKAIESYWKKFSTT